MTSGGHGYSPPFGQRHVGSDQGHDGGDDLEDPPVPATAERPGQFRERQFRDPSGQPPLIHEGTHLDGDAVRWGPGCDPRRSDDTQGRDDPGERGGIRFAPRVQAVVVQEPDDHFEQRMQRRMQLKARLCLEVAAPVARLRHQVFVEAGLGTACAEPTGAAVPPTRQTRPSRRPGEHGVLVDRGADQLLEPGCRDGQQREVGQQRLALLRAGHESRGGRLSGRPCSGPGPVADRAQAPP